MIRLLMITAALLLVSGCVSNPGNYYSYEGGGDYYYEDAGADVIIDSYPYGYGLGYGAGWGIGGFGYGYGGFGYGFGGYYGGYGYPWGYGYSPIWGGYYPPVIVVDSPRLRPGVEEERARRVALSYRPDGDYPESATWARRDRVGAIGNRRAGLTHSGVRRGTVQAPARVYGKSAATVTRSAPVNPSSGAAPVSRPTSRSYSRPASSDSRPMRSAPASRGSSRKH